MVILFLRCHPERSEDFAKESLTYSKDHYPTTKIRGNLLPRPPLNL